MSSRGEIWNRVDFIWIVMKNAKSLCPSASDVQLGRYLAVFSFATSSKVSVLQHTENDWNIVISCCWPAKRNELLFYLEETCIIIIDLLSDV